MLNKACIFVLTTGQKSDKVKRKHLLRWSEGKLRI